MAEAGVTKNQIISDLSRSPHGKLEEYVPMGVKATKQEPEFMAHLVAWNHQKGQVRDAKVALPIVTLKVNELDAEYVDNSLAHIALLGPRELERAYRFALATKLPGRMRKLRRIVDAYLRSREKNWPKWERLAIQHRKTLANLYALVHSRPKDDKMDGVLFGPNEKNGMASYAPEGTLFNTVIKLKTMSTLEAAGTIIESRLPFLIVLGALGEKAKEPDLVLALINRMSATELVSNTKMLEKMGVKTNPALRGAYETAIEKASTSSKNVLKTTRAAQALAEVDEDNELASKLRGLQERQIKAMGGVDGNWLVLGDKSPSMQICIEAARHVAATLAKFVKGKVHLVFFDSGPRHFDVSGKSYDQILKDTKGVIIGGGTSIGCGVQYALDYNFEVDGIAVVSDAQENTPPYFVDRYKKLCEKLGKEPTVYLYRFEPGMRGYSDKDLGAQMKQEGIDLQEFDLRSGKVDYYSLPNMVQTMRTNRYSLADEVLATKLLSLEDVLEMPEIVAA